MPSSSSSKRRPPRRRRWRCLADLTVASAAVAVGAVGTSGCRRPTSHPADAPPAATLAPPPSGLSEPVPRQAAAAALAAGATVTDAPASPLTRVPHATVVALSDWSAVLKPCGCTEELQRGGIERIAHWFGGAGASAGSIGVVHAGALLTEEQPPRPAELAQRALRVEAFVELVQRLPLRAVALSSVDLERGGPALRAAIAKTPLPWVAAGWDHGLGEVPTHRLWPGSDGVQVGAFGLDPAAGDQTRQQQLAQAEVEALRKAGATFVIALSNLGLRASRRLARAVPGLDAVVIGAVPERFETVEEPEREGQTWMIELPRQGAAMAQLTLARHGEAGAELTDASAWMPGAIADLRQRLGQIEARIERGRRDDAPLSARLALASWQRQAQELRQRIDRLQDAASGPLPAGRLAGWRTVALPWTAPTDAATSQRVKAYEAAAAKANEAALAQPVEAAPDAARYLGEATCLGCHSEAKAFAGGGVHAKAMATLERAGKTRDLDCVGCHVTGWQEPGGSAFGNLDRFANVQCEACHGPGSLHVAAADKKAPLAGFVAQPTAAYCERCHTPEHAPRFDFAAWRSRLLVPGHGLPAAK